MSQPEYLDGNAAAGVLADIFPVEMTVCSTTCGSCGARSQIGELVVYLDCPGTVLRCRACGAVLMKITQSSGQYWLDMSGVRVLQILPEGARST